MPGVGLDDLSLVESEMVFLRPRGVPQAAQCGVFPMSAARTVPSRASALTRVELAMEAMWQLRPRTLAG
jgi:hypothetical protein